MAKILSGLQPSGDLHIGNFFGMMRPMIQNQNENELYCFIVNYHAMTSVHDGQKLRTGTIEAAMDFLALGLDPDKSIFWVQSDVPEVLELSWILSTITGIGLLERCHSYKDKIAQGISANHALFSYPVLMAADILLFQAEIIPVGKDQKQHIEIARDIATSFNNQFGMTFVLPEARISDDISTIPGIDGRKMSKSYDNTIPIFLPEKKLKKKIMAIVTDSTPLAEPKDPNKCSVFSLYKLFASPGEIRQLAEKYREGGFGYGHAKNELFEKLWDYFSPYREKRQRLCEDKGQVINILKKGAQKARQQAQQTIDAVRRKTDICYW